MAVNEQELADTLHASFQLPREETLAYLRLLYSQSLTGEEIASALEMSTKETELLLAKMVERGLIIRTAGNPQKFTALHPRMTLTNLFKTYEREVVQGLRSRRATADRVVNLLTPIYEERKS